MGSDVYVSTAAFQADRLAPILELAHQASLTCVELSSGVPWEPGLLETVRNARGSFRYLVHNYFPPPAQPFVLNLAAAEPAVRAQSVAHCRQAIELCAELEASFYSVHSGLACMPAPEELGRPLTHRPRVSLDQAHELFVESLGTLCRHAARFGVELAIENNVIAPFNLTEGKNQLGLCARAKEVVKTIEDVGAGNLKCLVDTGHVKVTARTLGFDPGEFVRIVAPHVAAFHLSENDGEADTNQPFDESAWFLPHLALAPEAVAVLEVSRVPISALHAMCELVRSAQGSGSLRDKRP